MVKNEEKARMLSELLQALDFVTEVKFNQIGQLPASEENGEKADFFALAGIWEDRQIELEDIRRQAWPRQQ